MHEKSALNLTKELKGKAVLASDTAEKLGDIEDVIIHPLDGRVLGVILNAVDDGPRLLAARDFLIGKDAVMAVSSAAVYSAESREPFAEGVNASELVGASVVTEDGKLLGQISEVYVSVFRPVIAYRIAGSTLQRFFGGGFFLPGNAPRAYAPDGRRVIVPAEAEDSLAVESLTEALESQVDMARSQRKD